MRYRIILLIFMSSPAIFAKSIQVGFDNKHYEIHFMKDSIEFSEQGFSKKIKRQKCNDSLMDQFVLNFNANEKKLVDMKKEDIPQGSIKVALDEKTKIALRLNDEGTYFSDLPSKFKNLWLTSRRICSQ